MAYSDLMKNQKGLPDDEVLAGLYALSRVVKRQENCYADTSKLQSDEPSWHQKIFNKGKLAANPFFMNAYGQLSFITTGCKIGQCSFCSYGANTKELTPDDIRVAMEEFINKIDEYETVNGQKIYSILFDAVGSIFDKNEFSPECLDVVFEYIEKLLKKKGYIEDIGFETHYQTLGSLDENGNYIASHAVDKLCEFKRKHGDKNAFVVELGFESANPEIRDNIVFKHIDDETYKKAIAHLHANGVMVDLNVMATLPFLTKIEQVESSAKSAISALTPQDKGGYGADNIVMFPLNVRENTFCKHVMDLYDAEEQKNPNFKKPVWMTESFPIWSLVATLNTIVNSGHADMLDNISVAWFGNRSVESTDVPPKDFEDTYPLFVEYRKNKAKRVEIVKKLAQHPKFKEFLIEAEKEGRPDISIPDRAKEIYKFMEQHSPVVSPEILKGNTALGE